MIEGPYPKGARHRERDTLSAAWPWGEGGTKTKVTAKRATSFPWARAEGPPVGDRVRGPKALVRPWTHQLGWDALLTLETDDERQS
jgi:hypothetical protein